MLRHCVDRNPAKAQDKPTCLVQRCCRVSRATKHLWKGCVKKKVRSSGDCLTVEAARKGRRWPFNGPHHEIRMHRRPPERMLKQLITISLPRPRQPNGEGLQRREDRDLVHKGHEQGELASQLPVGTQTFTASTNRRQKTYRLSASPPAGLASLPGSGCCGGVRAGSALVVIRVPSPAPLVEGTQPSRVPREAARATELAVAMVIVDFLKTPAKRRPKAQESTGAAAPLPGGFRAAYRCRTTPRAVIPPLAEQVGPFKQTHVCPAVVISISWPISPMRSLLARLCKMPVFVQ